MEEACHHFPKISRRSIQDLWFYYRDHEDDENFALGSRRKRLSGRKTLLTDEIQATIVEIIVVYRGEVPRKEVYSDSTMV